MKRPYLLAFLGIMSIPGLAAAPGELSLDTAIELATQLDPWLAGSEHRQRALSDQAVAAAVRPDPRMNIGAANFPTDSFNIGQEPMTQVVVGVSQMFPRGETLALTRLQKEQLAGEEPLLRTDRKAKVTMVTAQLWLEVYKAQESIRLIEADRDLFDQLAEAALISYSSAVRGARQQDLIRAQLELTRLDDRLTVLAQQLQSAQQRLSEWIGGAATRPVSPTLPNKEPESYRERLAGPANSDAQIYESLRLHPTLLAFDQRIDARLIGVDLARQKYKPEWGLSAQYGVRAEDRSGQDRADLFSIGLTFDLPIFSRHRQDKEVSAALALTDATRSEKDLMTRQLMAELRTSLSQMERVGEREALYATELLPQMVEQAEASIAAYNNDNGDFEEAVRARIAEVDAKIDAIAIAVERRQLAFRLDYLLTQAPVSDQEGMQ